MPRRSSVEQLPEDIRDALGQKLVANGFADYDGLAEWLNEQGFEISRSSVHRWGQDFEARLGSLRRVTEQARALVAEAQDDEGALNEALIRLTQERLFEIMAPLEESLRPGDLAKVSRAVTGLVRASVNQKRWLREQRARDAAKLEEAVAAGKIDAAAAERALHFLGV